jgi:hypothetical protein
VEFLQRSSLWHGQLRVCGSDGVFLNVGYYGNWWSATEFNAYGAYNRYMGYYDEIAGWDSYGKDYLFSVRCLQD